MNRRLQETVKDGEEMKAKVNSLSTELVLAQKVLTEKDLTISALKSQCDTSSADILALSAENARIAENLRSLVDHRLQKTGVNMKSQPASWSSLINSSDERLDAALAARISQLGRTCQKLREENESLHEIIEVDEARPPQWYHEHVQESCQAGSSSSINYVDLMVDRAAVFAAKWRLAAKEIQLSKTYNTKKYDNEPGSLCGPITDAHHHLECLRSTCKQLREENESLHHILTAQARINRPITPLLLPVNDDRDDIEPGEDGEETAEFGDRRVIADSDSEDLMTGDILIENAQKEESPSPLSFRNEDRDKVEPEFDGNNVDLSLRWDKITLNSDGGVTGNPFEEGLEGTETTAENQAFYHRVLTSTDLPDFGMKEFQSRMTSSGSSSSFSSRGVPESVNARPRHSWSRLFP